MSDRDSKVADVHYEKLDSYGLLGGPGYRATVTLEDGRTGTSASYTAERASRDAASNAESSK